GIWEARKNEAKKRERGEFVKGCELLGDNLDRLTLIIQTLKDHSDNQSKLSNHLQKIDKKIYDFLKKYDKNQDRRIDKSGEKEQKNQRQQSRISNVNFCYC